MVLVTNTVRELTEVALETIGRGRFTTTVCGDEVVVGKPAPDPYLRAAELLGVPSADCLAVEDSPTGAQAASAAGCPTLVVESAAPVEPGRLRFVESPCRNRVCIHRGWLNTAGDSSACLPNRVSVSLRGTGAGAVDAVNH